MGRSQFSLLEIEISQHTAFRNVTGLGMRGTYDPLDLLAALLGAGAAYSIMRVFSMRVPPDAERLPA